MRYHSKQATILSGVLILFGTLFLMSCTMKTGAHITKVNPYHLQPGGYVPSAERMIDFEYDRKVFGAVTAADYFSRYGNYYTVLWKPKTVGSPATVRLQYCQATTGPKIFIKEQVVESPKRNNTTNFEVIGEEYTKQGAVTQWKASVIQDGSVIDEFKSFLWQ